jgi:exodeoxyribonuclease VII large subunit
MNSRRSALDRLIRQALELRRLRLERLSEGRYLWEPRRLIIERQQRVDQLEMRLSEIWKTHVHKRRSQVERITALLSAFRPAQWLKAKRAELAGLEARLTWIANSRLEAHKNRVAEIANCLRLLGPAQTLDRGYSITLDANGTVVRSVKGLKAGDLLQTRVADGEINSVVTK